MCENENIVDSDNDSDGECILSGYSLPNYLGSKETSNMQQSSLTRSQYASVVFHGVSDTYPPDGDIVFKYSLTEGVEPSPGDRIVVFAVGWSSIKDYIVFDWAPMPKNEERNSSVVFKANDLPKDTNEFYQVCYVSNEGSVFGASVPFQIRVNNDELTFAIEEDMVVVKSSNDLAKEKLLKAQVDRENLNREKTDLEKQLSVLKEKYEGKLRELKNLEEVLRNKNCYNEELRIENDARYREIECEIIELRNELKNKDIVIESMKFEKKKIEDELNALNIVIKDNKLMINNMKKNEKESEIRLIQAIEQIEKMRDAQEKLKNDLTISTRELKEIDIIRMRNISLENELTVCKFNLNNTQIENIRLKNESEEILKDNNLLNDKLRDVIETEEIRKNYYEEHSFNGNFDKGKLMMENTKLIKTSEELQYRISALEQEKLMIEQVLEETLEAQKNTLGDMFLDKKKYDNFSPSSSLSSSSSSSSSKVKENANEIEISKSEQDLLNKYHKRFNNELDDKSKGKIISSTDINDKKLFNIMSDNYLLIERLKEQSYLLIKKDKDIEEFKLIIDNMKKEFENLKIEYNQEINNLLLKNVNLVQEERNLQEFKNEMQRITFMNEELLTENSGLMERLRKMEFNKLSYNKEEDIKEISLELENKNLRKQLDTAYKDFDKTWKERNCDSLTLPKFIENGEISSCSKSTSDEKINDTPIIFEIPDERIEEIIKKRLEKLNFKFGINEEEKFDKQSSSSSSSSLLELKLEDINEKVEKVFTIVQKLSNDKENDIKNTSSSSSSSSVVSENIHHYDVNELKERLSKARFEYEKLQGVIIVYKKKYEDLKIKYKSLR